MTVLLLYYCLFMLFCCFIFLFDLSFCHLGSTYIMSIFHVCQKLISFFLNSRRKYAIYDNERCNLQYADCETIKINSFVAVDTAT
ncbi:hypothetical protein BDF20DRAFT_850499 [Mycotypha africana]|uniref:uncharacterized protein n=1 Tax=Mycotypha africana TaxID=64632 RepID=UPI0023008531|nr:uncharacterized protein BDF20DRAFT_850499 [Mycotypha africana]KAI8987474.1 hypothetical protein BDF20DRAFT_850499 [Mycotypha africana]